MKIPTPAMRTVNGLHAPANPASDDGRPKTPLPMTLLMTAAVSAHRPIARISDGVEDGRAMSAVLSVRLASFASRPNVEPRMCRDKLVRARVCQDYLRSSL